MTDTVPDTGMIEALRPLKTGGGGSQERPGCGNCPCASKDTPGAQGTLVCTRYPPEMHMTVKQTVGGILQVPQVGFKPVHDKMVCWEHPVLQARMRRRVAAHEAAANSLAFASFPPSQDALAIQRRVEKVADPDGREPGDEA